MLVLTRNIGQEIIIAGNIRLMVLGFQGSQVRLGIEAPKDVPVDRREVFERQLHVYHGPEQRRG